VIPVLLAAIAAGLVAFFLGRFDRRRALRRWNFVLSGNAEKAVSALRERFTEETDLVGHTYQLALARKKSLSYDEAVRLLGIAASMLEDAASDRQNRLRALSVFSRMAEAIVPVPPVRPEIFKLSQTRTLASLSLWLHDLLMGYHERFRFRLAVIGFGVRIVLRSIKGSLVRAFVEPAEPEPYQTFGDAFDDFRALDRVQVESFVLLLRSASATDRDDLPRELRDSRDEKPDND
jgi:hypothetical protein